MNPRASIALTAAILAAWLAPAAASAQEAVKRKAAGPPPPESWELTISPSPAPIPTFKYELIPSSARLTPGDGAPILLRLRYQPTDQEWAEIHEKTTLWAELPSGSPLPDEAAALVQKWRKALDLLAIGVRRESCDWGYPIREQSASIIDLAMPDVTPMRTWGRLQAVKARVQIARGDFAGASQSLATGFALGSKVVEGPFLINGMMGIAIDDIQLWAVEAWIATPGSPNLYWALTKLGRPLVSLERVVEPERLLIERAIPELADAPEPATPEGWSTRLAAIDRRMRDLAAQMFPPTAGNPVEQEKQLRAGLGADLSDYRRMHLEEFRRRLAEAGDFSADRLRAMSDDEAAVRGMMLAYHTVWDELFRDVWLSFNEAEPGEAAREAAWQSAKRGPVGVVALFLPAVQMARLRTSQLDRRVAMLRAVEAVRMYAAAHEGKLPAALDDVREVPVPDDPSTGKPFGWKVEGDAATLSVPSPRKFSRDYRITIRKP